MNIKVNIDRLILTGFGNEDTVGFVREFEQELSRLVMENGVSGVSSTGVLNAGTVHITRGAKPPQAAAADVARSIYKNMCSDARVAHTPRKIHPHKENNKLGET
jgi:hypothetical protein